VNIENWSYIPIGINTKTFCFPNPFRPDASSLLISLNGIRYSERVTLSIIEASTLDMVYSKAAEYTPFSGTQYVEWKGRDKNGYIVPSGVYLYILSDGEQIVKGKFAVIR
jgi:flagellar hook assembly protein FlgD